MTNNEFLAKYAPMLSAAQYDWMLLLTPAEEMSKVWEKIPTPGWLIDILKCEINLNYTPAVYQFLRFCFDKCYASALGDAKKAIANVIDNFDLFLSGSRSLAQMRDFYGNFDIFDRRMIANQVGTPFDRDSVHIVAIGLQWLIFEDQDVAPLYAIYHVVRRLTMHSFDEINIQLCDKLRDCIGNPYA
jgi:hypothetical protein